MHFCGLPNEEQLGYALYGADGGRGELVFRYPDQWSLFWKAPRELVRETWTVVAPDLPLVRREAAIHDAPENHRLSAIVTSLLR